MSAKPGARGFFPWTRCNIACGCRDIKLTDAEVFSMVHKVICKFIVLLG